MTNKRKISVKGPVAAEKSDARSMSVYAVKLAVEHSDQLKDFDPYDEMCVEKPTTYTETLINFVKANLGTGILALPNAFYHSGYLLGTIFMLAVVMLSVYCKHLQLRVNYVLSKKKRVACLSFTDTIDIACAEGPTFFQKTGPYLRFLTDFSIALGQFGTGIVYIVFVSSNLKEVCDVYYGSVDERLYMLSILLPLIFMNYIRSFKYLAPISLVSNIVSFAGYGIIMYYIFTSLRPLSERSAVGEFQHIPLFLGTVFFVYEPAAMVIPMRREMKQPGQFASKFGVFHLGTVLVCMFYFSFGFFGYMAYGADSLGSVTLNLPLHELPANIARLSQCAVIFLSHAIQNYLVYDILWYQWLSKKFVDNRWGTLAEYSFRTFIVCSEFMMAVAVPNLDLVISLLGALGGPFTGYMVPAAMHASLHWKSSARKGCLVAHVAVLWLISALAASAGVAAALTDIVRVLQ